MSGSFLFDKLTPSWSKKSKEKFPITNKSIQAKRRLKVENKLKQYYIKKKFFSEKYCDNEKIEKKKKGENKTKTKYNGICSQNCTKCCKARESLALKSVRQSLNVPTKMTKFCSSILQNVKHCLETFLFGFTTNQWLTLCNTVAFENQSLLVEGKLK